MSETAQPSVQLTESAFFDPELLEIFTQLDDVVVPPSILPSELYLDIVQVATDLGQTPTRAQYQQLGTFSPFPVITRFGDGSWCDAMENLGYNRPADSRRPIADAELERDLNRVSTSLGHTPTVSEYTEHGKYAPATLMLRFGDGSWIDTLVRLGYDDARDTKRVSTTDLEHDVRRVATELGHAPKTTEYDELGNHAPSTVLNRLGNGSWERAMDTIEFDFD